MANPIRTMQTTHQIPATTVTTTESAKSALPRSSSPATASSALLTLMRVSRAAASVRPKRRPVVVTRQSMYGCAGHLGW